MPELTDLRAALTQLADQIGDDPHTPLIDALIADVRPARFATRDEGRRRRRRAVLAAVAATIVAGAGASWLTGVGHRERSGPVATHRSHETSAATPPATATARPSRFATGIPAPAATASVPLRLDFALAAVPGVAAAPLEANRLFQSESILFTALHNTSQDVAPGGELYVYYRGVFDPSSVPHLSAVDVNGHRGWVTRSGAPSEIKPVTAGTTDGIVWEYAHDAWSLLLVDHSAYRALGQDTKAGNLALARAVHAGTQTLSLPFRTNYLPAGLRADGASSITYRDANRKQVNTGQLGLGDGRPRAKGTPADEQVGSALQISVETRRPGVCVGQCHTVRVGDLDVSVFTEHGRPTEVSADRGTGTMTVSVDRAHLGRFTVVELERVLAGITVAADVGDRATWFDAQRSRP